MVTLSPILAELGYETPAQQRSFVKLLQATGCLGDLPGVGALLTDKQAEALLTQANVSSREDALHWLHATTQAHWINRKPGQERFAVETPTPLQDREALLKPVLMELGAFAPRTPHKAHYDHVLLLGATEPAVDTRLQSLKQAAEAGVSVEHIYLLGSNRPLLPQREPSAASLPPGSTESTLLEARYRHAFPSLPDSLKDTPVTLVDTTRSGNARPTTRDTVQGWLSGKPAPGSVLVISSQPYAAYQEAAVKSVLPAEFSVETIGAGADMATVSTGMALDNMARQIDASLPRLLARSTALPESVQELVMVTPGAIQSDPARFQYRKHTDAHGVREEKQFQGKWNPLLHADPVLLYEQKDGQRFVVDGHHRVEFAQRLNSQGKGPAALPARILKEADGFTAEDAKVIGAYKNFSNDLRNPAKEYTNAKLAEAASVFHSVHAGKARTEVLPALALEGDLAKAYAAGSLSEPAFSFVERGEVPVIVSAEVAKRVETPTEQVQVMEILRNKIAAIGAEAFHDTTSHYWRDKITGRMNTEAVER